MAPPAAAVIVTLPECAAVTRPLDETVPIVVFELDHATAPVRTFPLASVSLALSWRVPPVTRLSEAGETTMLLTAPADTTTAAVPVTPLADAEIVALPGWTAVTRPPELTVTIEALELDQLIV
jgi:hypothetical protein